MDYSEIKYHGEFSFEERKAMTASALRDLRKSNKLSQKEVAAYLNIPATTYNTYESGRTEPPIEILVRLSHLYNISVDFIVMRDRMYRTADDLEKKAIDYKQYLAELDKAIAESNGPEVDLVHTLRTQMERLADAMIAFSHTQNAHTALDDTLTIDP